MTDVRQAAMTMKRVDTHSHFQVTENWDIGERLKALGDFVNGPDMVVSRACAIGAQKLHGVDVGLFLRDDAPPEFHERSAALRAKGHAAMLETAMDTENITIQFCFSGPDPQNSPLPKLSPRVRLLAYIDPAICGQDIAFCPDGADMEFNYYDALCNILGELPDFDAYLGAIDAAIDSWRDHRVVGMKTALAYTLGLKFSDPTEAEARAAFTKKRDMSAEEITAVQHYAFRHSLLACQRNGIPVVVHTGFQIWGHSDLQISNPILLHNLLVDKRYKDVVWVLLHGGNPYTGETTFLARMFDNVHIDFTWISWMTRARFRMALAEWIEIVPHGKICWGSDSGIPENIVGIGQITREVIANVLEDQIQRRIIDERIALDWLEHTYMKTPTRLFGL